MDNINMIKKLINRNASVLFVGSLLNGEMSSQSI